MLGTQRRRYALIRALPFKERQRDMSPTAFYSPERRRNFRSSIFLSSFPLSLSPRSREKYGKGVAERKEERKMLLVRRSSVSRPLWRMDRDLDQSFSGGGRRRGRHAITPFPPLWEGGMAGVAFDALLHTALRRDSTVYHSLSDDNAPLPRSRQTEERRKKKDLCGHTAACLRFPHPPSIRREKKGVRAKREKMREMQKRRRQAKDRKKCARTLLLLPFSSRQGS